MHTNAILSLLSIIFFYHSIVKHFSWFFEKANALCTFSRKRLLSFGLFCIFFSAQPTERRRKIRPKEERGNRLCGTTIFFHNFLKINKNGLTSPKFSIIINFESERKGKSFLYEWRGSKKLFFAVVTYLPVCFRHLFPKLLTLSQVNFTKSCGFRTAAFPIIQALRTTHTAYYMSTIWYSSFFDKFASALVRNLLPNKFHFCRNGTNMPPSPPFSALYLYRYYFPQVPFYVFWSCAVFIKLFSWLLSTPDTFIL